MSKNLKKIFLLLLFVFLLPITLFWAKTEFTKKSEISLVPKRSEQPKDTEIMAGVITIHYWKTDKNTDVYFVPTEKLPIVDIYINFNAGSARDGALFGLAGLHSSLLEEGTLQLNAEQIAEQFENVGAEFDSRVSRDRTVITLRSLSSKEILFPAVDLVSNIISEPTFNEQSLTQLKNQLLVNLKQNNNLPGVVATQALYQILYPNHPYGHLISGTIEGISKITRTDLVSFHKEYFVSKNASIIIVGGIHRDLARDISNRILNKLETGKAAEKTSSIIPLAQAEEKRISFPSAQTHIMFGSVFNLSDKKEFNALQVANYILGEGPLVARLFKDLRDKHGYTYNVGSALQQFSEGGIFTMYMQTKTSQAQDALVEAQKVLKQFVEEGPTEKEVEDAKQGIIGAFPLTIGNNARIADTLAEMIFYKKPLDYLNIYPKEIEKLSRETIQETFKKYIHPDKMALVIVGENVY